MGPNSPDLNPVDYKILGEMQQRVYQTKVHDLDELKQRLINVWHGLGQNIIDDAIDEWRKCYQDTPSIHETMAVRSAKCYFVSEQQLINVQLREIDIVFYALVN